MMMNLRHIEVFHAVYQTGSVSAAARLLNVSQPTVSKVLKHAESRIGFRLFLLVKGRLVPTDDAHVIHREASELYARYESLQETAANLRRGEGSLKLAVLPSLGLDIAPRAVAKFHEAQPSVAVEIQTLHNEDILRTLYERGSDLAISYDAPRHPRLKAIRVGTGNLVALYRKKDFIIATDTVPLERFKSQQLIRLSASGFVSDQVDRVLRQTACISVQTYYVAAALVHHGVGFAIVDEFTARASQKNDLDFKPLRDMAPLTVYCAYLEDKPLSILAKKFVKVLKQTISAAHV